MPPSLEAEAEADTTLVLELATVEVRWITKYRPISQRIAVFTPLAMPSPGIDGVRASSVSGRFLFCTCM